MIRCRECKHAILHGNVAECKAHEEIGYDPEQPHELDWFCADGEKTDGTKNNTLRYFFIDKDGNWHQIYEEKPPVDIEIEGGGSTWWYVCGECHGAIDERDAYCRHCGRKLRKQ